MSAGVQMCLRLKEQSADDEEDPTDDDDAEYDDDANEGIRRNCVHRQGWWRRRRLRINWWRRVEDVLKHDVMRSAFSRCQQHIS